jgi:hypothetical protein
MALRQKEGRADFGPSQMLCGTDTETTGCLP